jgi:hypothetical protein
MYLSVRDESIQVISLSSTRNIVDRIICTVQMTSSFVDWLTVRIHV